MAPYTSAPQAPDPFTATRTRMEEMLAHLSAPAMASATAEGLEDYITAAGREVLRQMLQDQLDARAAAEVRVEVVTGSDAVVRPRAERSHRRLLATTLGRVEATRIAYRAPVRPTCTPATPPWPCRGRSTPTRYSAPSPSRSLRHPCAGRVLTLSAPPAGGSAPGS